MAVTTSQITITTMEGWYSGDTAPSNPLIGDLWLDTTSNEIKKWDGTNWVKQADTQGPQGPKGDSIKSRDAYWIKNSTKPDKPTSETIGNWTPGSEPPETVLNNIGEKDKFWRVYKITYSNGENEYSEYSEVELIGSYEVLKGLVQFRNGVSTTENGVTVIDGGKIHTGSIKADKIQVEDLEALKATIGGFHIGKNSIYSGNKKTIDSTERGIYFDSNGQSYFGDDKNFIRFYRSDKDNYKLQISADSLTFGSGVSVEKAFEDIKGDIQNAQGTANAAQNAANTAQNTANKAQNAADTAQNTATEAAKTADNYISADSTGIMVSENKGATKETPSNATKNNVLITEKNVQIRNGQKVVASYGELIRLGEATGQNISVDNAGLAIQDGDKKQFEVRTLTDGRIFTDVWLDEGRISPDSGIDTSKVFYAAEIDSVLDSAYYYEEILNLTFPSQGVPKVTLIFGGGNSGYNVPADPSSAIYFTAADQAIEGEALKLVIDYRDNPSGVSGGFNWSDLSAIKVEYTINFTPTTVRIGDGATEDTFINDGTTVNSFKAFKVGKGMGREGNWQKDNAFDVDFNGNTYVGGELAVNQDILNQGGQIYTGAITTVNDVYARNVYSERPDGTMLSVVDLIYPVGSIYMSVNSADPETLFGGTWQQIKDRFLLSAGDTYAAGNTGGSAKATLPSHTHTFGSGGYQMWGAKIGTGSTEPGNQISGDAKYYAAVKGKSTSNYKWIENVDSKGVSDVSQANMPPYLTVYVWKRIS